MPLPWIIAALALVIFLAWYLSFSAARLDRLHARVEGALSALDAQLVRRASVSMQLATSGMLDPATALLLADAAHEAREAKEPEREQAESDLTKALLAAFAEPDVVPALDADPVGRALAQELAAACLRVQLARQIPQRRRGSGARRTEEMGRSLAATRRARALAADLRDRRHSASYPRPRPQPSNDYYFVT